MTDSRQRTRRLAIRLTFGLLTFGLLCLLVHPRDIIATLTQADLRYVAAGLALCVVGVAARALRWQLLLRHMDIRLRFGRALEIYTISYWFNTFLPGSVGGDLYKVYDVARASAKKLRPVVAVAAERLTGILALLALTLVGLFHFRQDLHVPHWVVVATVTLTAAAMLVLLVVLTQFGAMWRTAVAVMPSLARLVSAEKTSAFDELSQALKRNPRFFLEAFAIGLVVQLITFTSYSIIAWAVTSAIPPAYFFAYMPLVEIGSMIPISVNGIGIKEGLIVLTMEAAEVHPAQSLSLAILYRIVALIHGLAGGIALTLRRNTQWTTAAEQVA